MSFDGQVRPLWLQDIQPKDAAVFLDFDGVIVDIAPTPDAVDVTPETLGLLAVLEHRLDGALAIVTGRSIADLRKHLPVVPRNVIGSHGAEWLVTGREPTLPAGLDADAIFHVHTRAASAEHYDGVMVEQKPTGAALHFRNCPERKADVRALCDAIVDETPGMEVLAAKCAFEIRPIGIDKDKAVAEAMLLPDFTRRIPVYIGDDTTDEPALAWVMEHGGIAIKVGEGPTAAPFRLANPMAVQLALADWLYAEETA